MTVDQRAAASLEAIDKVRRAAQKAGSWPTADVGGPKLEHDGQLRMARARRAAGLPPQPRDLEAFAVEEGFV